MIDLGSRLKLAREKSNMTQKEVCKRLGISIGTLSGYERNYRDPDTEILANLAAVYQISVDYLLGIEKYDIPSWANENEKLDLKAFLDNQQEMYYGDIKLTEEEKKQLNDIVVGVFWKRMKEAKDKQVDKE